MGNLLEAVSSAGQGIQANEVAKRNAAIDEEDARLAIQDARSEAAIENRRGTRVAAEQAVAFAGGGVRSDVGTPLTLAAQEVVNAELRSSDALRRGAFESNRRKQSAALQRFRGKSVKRAGFIKAGAQILNTLGKSGSA